VTTREEHEDILEIPNLEACHGTHDPKLIIIISISSSSSSSMEMVILINICCSLSYIRSITCNNMTVPVNLVSVSETVGDIALVSSANAGAVDMALRGSVLWLYSINAVLIGTVATRECITALCFSGAPEGLSVNIIAAGLASGAIRLETFLIHFVLCKYVRDKAR
jgi:hypothetical protein